MKTKLLYISIISLLFILQACKRTEPDCGDLSDVITNYNIADSNKAKIPYSGTDTLVFVSNSNDTAVLIGQGKKSFQTAIRNSIAGGDCPRNAISNYDNIKINFLSYNLLLANISLSIYKYEKFGGSPNSTSINFRVNDNEIALTNLEYLTSIKTPQDSIMLNGINVGGVYMEDDTKAVVYSLKYGVLKFKDLNNAIWILNTKK